MSLVLQVGDVLVLVPVPVPVPVLVLVLPNSYLKVDGLFCT